MQERRERVLIWGLPRMVCAKRAAPEGDFWEELTSPNAQASFGVAWLGAEIK